MAQQDYIRSRVDAFQDRHGMRAVYLALHAAFPLSLSPGLLYLLRDNFQRDVHGRLLDIPWEAVGDLLLSELCQETGHEQYRMGSELRQHLLERLRKMPRFGEVRIQELHAFVDQYYGPFRYSVQPEVRALAEAQLWAAQLQAEPEAAVKVLSQTLFAAQEKNDLALQLRLHYLLEGFPELQGEMRQLQHYTQAVALDGLGLEGKARVAAQGLAGVSGGTVDIGGVRFGVKGEWDVEGQGARGKGQGNGVSDIDLVLVFSPFDKEMGLFLSAVCDRFAIEGLVQEASVIYEPSDLQDLGSRNRGNGQMSVVIFVYSDSFFSTMREAPALISELGPVREKGWLKVVTVDIERYDTLFLQIKTDMHINLVPELEAHGMNGGADEFRRRMGSYLEQLRSGDDDIEVCRNIQQQLRWLGMYDGPLDGDWWKIKAFLMKHLGISGEDDGSMALATAQELMEYTEEWIAADKKDRPQIKAYLENTPRGRQFLEQILIYWGVDWSERSVTVHQNPPAFEIYDDDSIISADVVIVGVDQPWLESSRFDHIISVARANKKPIVPVILENCGWRDSVLNEYQNLPSEGNLLGQADEEALRQDVEFHLGQALRAVSDRLIAKRAEWELEFSEEGKARVREVQEQLRWLGEYEGPLDGEWRSIAVFFPDWRGQPFEARVETAMDHNRKARGDAEALLVSVDNLGQYAEVLEPVLQWWRVRRLEDISSLKTEVEIPLIDVFIFGIDSRLTGKQETFATIFQQTEMPVVVIVKEKVNLAGSYWERFDPFLGFITEGVEQHVANQQAQLKLAKALKAALYARQHVEADRDLQDKQGANQVPPRLYLLYHDDDAKLGRELKEQFQEWEVKGKIQLLDEKSIYPLKGEPKLARTWTGISRSDIVVVLISPSAIGDQKFHGLFLGDLHQRLVSGKLNMIAVEILPCNWDETVFAKAQIKISIADIANIIGETLVQWAILDKIDQAIETIRLETAPRETEEDEDGDGVEAHPNVLMVNHAEDYEMAKAVEGILRENGIASGDASRISLWEMQARYGGGRDGIIVVEGIQGRRWLQQTVEKIDGYLGTREHHRNPIRIAVVGHPKRKDKWPKLPEEWMIVDVHGFAVSPIWTDFVRRVEKHHQLRINESEVDHE